MSTKTVPTTKIREVSAFVEAQEALKEFKNKHSGIFTEFEELVNEYNQKLESAEKMVRQQGVSCGPFECYQWQTKYDAKILYDALGRERFLQVGGILSTQTVYDVDKLRVSASINSGQIPEEIVGSFKTDSPRYHKPEKVSLP